MLSYSQRPGVGAVGAKLLYPDGTVQHAGVIIGLGGSAGHSHKGHPANSAGDMYRLATAQNFSAVTGACLMVKKSLYDALGGLDETNFAVAYNDVDFCLRPVSYTHLDVYKRQIEIIARHLAAHRLRVLFIQHVQIAGHFGFHIRAGDECDIAGRQGLFRHLGLGHDAVLRHKRCSVLRIRIHEFHAGRIVLQKFFKCSLDVYKRQKV